jgi:hypothetical protein
MGTSSLKQIQQQINKILGRDLSARVSRAGMWTLYFIGIGIIAGTGRRTSSVPSQHPGV